MVNNEKSKFASQGITLLAAQTVTDCGTLSLNVARPRFRHNQGHRFGVQIGGEFFAVKQCIKHTGIFGTHINADGTRKASFRLRHEELLRQMELQS